MTEKEVNDFINAFFPLNEEKNVREPDLERIKQNLIYQDQIYVKLELVKSQRNHWLFSFCAAKGFKTKEIENKISEEDQFLQQIGNAFHANT